MRRRWKTPEIRRVKAAVRRFKFGRRTEASFDALVALVEAAHEDRRMRPGLATLADRVFAEFMGGRNDAAEELARDVLHEGSFWNLWLVRRRVPVKKIAKKAVAPLRPVVASRRGRRLIDVPK